MNISTNGINLIKAFESLSLKVYYDGGGVKTVGYGNTSHAKTMKIGELITQEQATSYLEEDLKDTEDSVNHFLITFGSLKQNEYDALISAVFNIGPTFLTTYNGPATFCRYVSDNGIIQNGLLKRRALEGYIFQVGFTPKALAWILNQKQGGT